MFKVQNRPQSTEERGPIPAPAPQTLIHRGKCGAQAIASHFFATPPWSRRCDTAAGFLAGHPRMKTSRGLLEIIPDKVEPMADVKAEAGEHSYLGSANVAQSVVLDSPPSLTRDTREVSESAGLALQDLR